MPKLSNPLPQPLPKECAKAAKIFRSFVDSGNNGLDGVIPRSVLTNAKGFAIFTIIKAGFVFSARAGSGIVIARLDDGTWSAPSAIGTAGVGGGVQAGAEMTDFLIVLNSRSRSFMSAGSLTLGGNLSLAIGPLGRNGEALGSLNTNGKVAAMYSYSKTRGLFGGISLEGSVIVERQDANAQAYSSPVTARLLLGGHVDPPSWAQPLIQTLQSCTGLPGGQTWVQDTPDDLNDPPPQYPNPRTSSSDYGYAFGNGVSSSGGSGGGSSSLFYSPSFLRRKKSEKVQFPPPSWGKSKEGGSYFTGEPDDIPYSASAAPSRLNQPSHRGSKSVDVSSLSSSSLSKPSAPKFETHFESDYNPDIVLSDTRTSPTTKHARFNSVSSPTTISSGSRSQQLDLLDTPNEFDFSKSTHPAAAFARASGINNNTRPRGLSLSGRNSNTSNGGTSSPNSSFSSTPNNSNPFLPSTAISANSPYNSTGTGVNANNLHSNLRKLSMDSRSYDLGVDGYDNDSLNDVSRNSTSTPYIHAKPELTKPLKPGEGVARAIALYDFQAVESGDLSFKKGTVITVTKMSDSTDDWWTGKALGHEGIFPANFVELVERA
ncbi:hypothetical protein AX16_002580 [Volvariella volvacea WC 439]|nr:hypothetical protein AX16_002580 [Volvariella volvacea WC 439]